MLCYFMCKKILGSSKWKSSHRPLHFMVATATKTTTAQNPSLPMPQGGVEEESSVKSEEPTIFGLDARIFIFWICGFKICYLCTTVLFVFIIAAEAEMDGWILGLYGIMGAIRLMLFTSLIYGTWKQRKIVIIFSVLTLFVVVLVYLSLSSYNIYRVSQMSHAKLAESAPEEFAVETYRAIYITMTGVFMTSTVVCHAFIEYACMGYAEHLHDPRIEKAHVSECKHDP